MKTVSVLFARSDSIYKKIKCCDVWDSERNALNYKGDLPVIAHPPCRLFSRLRAFSTAPISEKKLAYFAVDCVRCYGGVLEHPSGSLLFKEYSLPLNKEYDNFGGFTISVNQSWWQHPCTKKTLLYIKGCKRSDVPAFPLNFDLCSYCITSNKKNKKLLKECRKDDRDKTPYLFALWLIELAKKCK